MQIRLPQFRALLQADPLSRFAAERFVAEHAEHLPTPALRLLPRARGCKPTPLVDRPSARVKWVGNVAYAVFV